MIMIPFSSQGHDDSNYQIAPPGTVDLPDVQISGHFTENLGQWDDSISYIGNTPGGHIGLGSGNVYLDILDLDPTQPELISSSGHVLVQEFLGSSYVEPAGLDLIDHRNNYLLGNDPDKWVSGAANYQRITYNDLWEDIDLDYVISSAGPKYEFTLAPYSDPEDIRIGVKGQRDIHTDGSSLVFDISDDRSIVDTGLIAYHTDDLSSIDVSFRLIEDDIIGFDLGDYDRSRSVVIDPILKFTYLGGSGGDRLQCYTNDEFGNVYISGITSSSNFPITPGAYSSTYGGHNYDSFITKLDSTFSSLGYSTYMGGNHVEYGYDIEVVDGEAIVTGYTHSTDFPTTSGSYDDSYNGWSDIFVSKINKTGGSFVFSTMVGSTANETASSMEIDSDGNIVILGGSTSYDFPTTSGAYAENRYGGSGGDLVIFKMDPNGTKLIYSSFFGSNNWENPFALRLTPDDKPVIMAQTGSTTFPTTDGAYSKSLKGLADLGIAQFDRNVTDLEFSTYFGGNGYDFPNDLLVCSNGDIAVTGHSNNIPTTDGAYDTSYNGDNDLYVSRFNWNCSKLLASTYFGGTGNEANSPLREDEEGNFFLYGETTSTDLTTTTGAFDTTFNGTNNQNLFVAKMDGNLTTLMYNTYIGGDGYDDGHGMIVETPFKVIIGGLVSSTDFEIIGGGFDTMKDTGADGFMMELSLLAPPTPPRNLTATRGDNWVQLSWKEPLSDGGRPIYQYHVYRGPSPGSKDLLVSLDPDIYSYNDTTIKVDGEYFYYVMAENDIDESEKSNILRIADIIPPWIIQDLTPGSAVSAEELTFSVRAMDNAFVDEVFVEYRIGSRSPFNLTMQKSGPGLYSTSIQLPDDVFILSYRISLNDTSDNWVSTPDQEVSVNGEVNPVFGNNLTQTAVRAGEKIRFLVEVTDNVEVKNVWAEFWSDSMYKQNRSMSHVEGDLYEFQFKTRTNSLDPVGYRFKASDVSGHWNVSEEGVVAILDAEGPNILGDSTYYPAEAGQIYSLSVHIGDNEGVADAWVEYSINDYQFNDTLVNTAGSTYKNDIQIPQALGRLSFSFHAVDLNGNPSWLPWVTVPILDYEDPVIIEDRTDRSGTAGSDLHFNLEASDNIGVDLVTLEYWFEGTSHSVVEVPLDEYYKHTTPIPSNFTGEMRYFFTVSDRSGNSVEGDTVTVVINDEEIPILISDLTPSEIETGGELTFTMKVHDHVGIKKVTAQWGFKGSAVRTDLNMVYSGGYHSASIEVPMDSTTDIVYSMRISDSSDNILESPVGSVKVIDTVSPTISGAQDLKIGPMTDLNIEISAQDNIGIESFVIENCPITPVDGVIQGRIDEPGTYPVRVTAVDLSGNRVETTFLLTVEDGSGSDDDGDPFWIYLPPIIGILILIGAVLIFVIGRKGGSKEYTPPTPPPVQEPPSMEYDSPGVETHDDLRDIFNR